MFAKGKHAVAICQRSGKKIPYKELVSDGYTPGLMVARDERDTAHPQERPVRIKEGIALRRPSPETVDETSTTVLYDATSLYNSFDEYGEGTSLAESLFPGESYFGGAT